MLSYYISILETEEEKKKMTEIYEEHRQYCVFIAKKLLNNLDDAEDATHAAFMEIIKHKNKYLALRCSDFRALLVVIVKNKAYDILRLRKKERADDTDMIGYTADDTPPVDEVIINFEEYELLREALKKLAPSYNNILTLKYFEDKSNSEIAENLQTNNKNVEVMLYRAKNSLRKTLAKMKGTSDETTRV